MADTETSDTGVASNDAYTGLLAISLIALIIGSVLLFLDYSQHSGTPPKANLNPVPAIKMPEENKPPVEKDVAGKDAVGKDAVGKDAKPPEAK